MKEIICRKCAGNKTIETFKHVEGGICFTCNGSGIEIVDDNTSDIVKEIRAAREAQQKNEMEFTSLFNDHKDKMSIDWKNYILNHNGSKYNKLQNYLLYKQERKERVKAINIDDDDFHEKYNELLNELESKYMIEEE